MAKKKTKKKKFQKPDLKLNNRNKLIAGLVFIFIGIMLFLSIISYFFNWQYDQSNLELTAEGELAHNWGGKLGAWLSHKMVFNGFGIFALMIPYAIVFSGLLIIAKRPFVNHLKRWIWAFIYMYTGAFLLAVLFPDNYLWSGLFGKEIAYFSNHIFGKIGTIIVLLFILLSIISIKFGLDVDKITGFFTRPSRQKSDEYEPKVTEDDEPAIPTQEVGIMEIDDDMVIKTTPDEEETSAVSNKKKILLHNRTKLKKKKIRKCTLKWPVMKKLSKKPNIWLINKGLLIRV